MFRRVIAGLILGPALLIGSFAWSGYLALSTIFDENRSATVAQELVGWTPQHTTASMLDRAHTWWRNSDRADTAYDWTTEDQILAMLGA